MSDFRIINAEVQGHVGYVWQNITAELIYRLDKTPVHSGSGIISDEIIIRYRDTECELSNIINDVFIHDSRLELADFSMSEANLYNVIGTKTVNRFEGFYSVNSNPNGAQFYIYGSAGVEHEVVFEDAMEIRGGHGLLHKRQ